VPCPAGVAELARGMHRVDWGGGSTAWIVPGVSCRDEHGIPDVMRGEEVQALGALPGLDPSTEWLCLPGTHNKWVRIQDGRIASFTTHMTGEWFALAKAQSAWRDLR